MNLKQITFCCAVIFCFISGSVFAQTVETGRESNKGTVNFTALANYLLAHPEPLIQQVKSNKFVDIPRNRPVSSSMMRSRSMMGPLPFIPVGPGGPLPMSPSPSDTFQAVLDNSTSIPPDTHGAVDGTYCVTAVNPNVRIQTRTGTVVSTVSLNAFFNSVNSVGGVFDPRVHYDPFSNRWILVAVSGARNTTDSTSILIGVSQTGNPTGTWNLFRVRAYTPGGYWLDYPNVGFNSKWITVTGNLFPDASGSYLAAKTFVFNKANLMAGTSASFTSFLMTSSDFTLCPAINYDNSNTNMFAVENWNGTVGAVKLWKISGAVGSEALTAVGFIISPNDWHWGVNAFSGTTGVDFAPQSGTSNKVQTNDDRINQMILMNGKLWFSHTVFMPYSSSANPTRASVQWWQTDTAISGSFIPTVQVGLIDDNTSTNFYAFPSIAVNTSNDALIGFSRFSATTFPSAAYAMRVHTDVADSTRPVVVYRNGLANYYKTYSGTKNRWGDYSGTCLDPTNSTDFWTIQEASSHSNLWDTRWAHVAPPCTTPGSITGAAIVCVGFTTTLSNSVSGGTWTSGTTSVATVNSTSGVVTGVAAGTSTITYSMGGTCFVTRVVTVNTQPTAITGTQTVCTGFTTTFSSSPGGGTWTSSNTAIGTVSTGGVVTGISAGTATITYTLSGGCLATRTVTVNTQPTAITGTASVCVGLTTTLNSTPSGGTWSSSNTAQATVVPSTGIVTGVAAGNPVITYTFTGGCFVIRTMTVNTQPTAITGTQTVCVGSTTTFSSSPTGGTWTSSNTAVGTVSSGGVVTGISAGTATITYTLTGGCFATRSVTVNAQPTAITGTASVCAGSTTTLSSSPTGGTWTSSNTAVGTVSTGGAVTGMTAGTTTITYTLSGGCFSTRQVTVNAQPTAITGTATVCTGSTTTLSSSPTGGTWTSSNTAVGTVSTGGVVTGLTAGTTTITYTLTGGCFVTQIVTVNTQPAAITGTASVCAGSTTTLSSSPTGGTWTSSNTAVGTVSTGGVVTGLTAGNTTITYTLAGGCFSNRQVTVNAQPTAITGTATVCTGATTTLSSSPTGGTWTSSNTAVGTVSSGGVVTGLTAGTTTITYTLTGGCFSTRVVTVNTSTGSITGIAAICTGMTTTLNCTPTGGTWTSANLSIATVGSASGIVTGLATGTADITYTLTGGCFSVRNVTVNTTPGAIGGTAIVCVSSTTTLNCTPGTGTWSSSNAAIASVGTGNGVVTGMTSGTATITYTLSTGCFSARQVTVVASPTSITGAATVCVGSSTTLSSTPTGGTWTSSIPGVATVGGGTGIVNGISAGTADITYTLSAGCFTTRTVTVNTSPAAITGTALVCVAANTTLSSATSGGTWASSTISVAVVSSASGIVTGISAGTATITYMISNGCFVTQVVTVVATPSAITGTAGLCIGSSTTLSSSPSGGNWSSGATGIATVGSTGVVTGVSAGNADITYSFGGSCFSTRQVTVHISVASITGSLNVCVAGTTTLSCSTTGGTWLSGSPSVATVVAGTGLVTGASAGTADITYSLGVGCESVATVTVLATPSAISGTPVVCIGNTTTLSSSPTGGTWTSSTPVVGTVSGGVVTGLTGGTTIITYTLSTGCFVTRSVTVNPNPGAIGGIASVCVGSTTTLNCTPSGGSWSSANTGLATVHSGNGAVTGVSAGTVDITYILGTGCFSVRNVTVDVAPAPISGASVICTGTFTTFSSTPTGGTWTSSTPAVATVGSSTGIVSGASTGTATITYTLSSGCFVTKPVTVSNSPSAITGTLTVCAGATTTLSSSPTGGTWSSSATGVASVNSTSGLVTGVSAGTANITYTIGGGCFITAAVTVNAAPGSISGASSVCIGTTTIFSSTPTGGVWTSSAAGIAAVGSASGAVLGVSSGSATITYMLSGGCFVTKPVTVNTLPTITLGTNPTVISGATSANLPYSATSGSPSAYSIVYSSAAVTAGFANVSSAALSSSPIVLTVPGTAPAAVYTATLTVTSALCTSINYPFTVTVNSGINTPPVFTGGSPQTFLACAYPSLNPINALLAISDPDVGNIETWTVLSTPSHGTIFTGTTAVSTGGTIPPVGFTYRGAYGYLGTDAFTIQVSDGAGGTATTTINVTVNPMPAPVTVTGGGGYCSGGAGVSVGLSGSAVGVNYQLYRNGSPVGSPVAGIGAGFSFGMQTIAGTYTATASSASAPCTQAMTGSVTVTVYGLPGVYTVTGGGSFCPGGTGVAVGLSGSDIGVNYRLYRGGTPVGSPVAGTGTVLNFGLQTTTGTYTVVATASPTGCISNMTGSVAVSLNPVPTAHVVTGGGGFCLGGTGVNIGLSSSDVGVNYQLRRGTISVGSPVAGTGTAINFGLFTIVGTYTVVATNTTTGCTGNMSGSASVTVKPLPYVFTVTGGGSYCAGGAGVLIGLSGTVSGTSYQLYNGATAIGSPVAGTGAPINFGLQTTVGIYTVVATAASTGCSNNMAGSAAVIVIALPAAYTVTGGGSFCAGSTGMNVGLSSSNVGVNYQLYRGTTPVGSLVAGTGAALNFGVFTTAGVYTVRAYVASTSCTSTMTGSVTISVNPLPAAYTVSGGGAYCSGGSGNHIYLSNSTVGVNYQLYLGATPVGSLVAGTGAALDFGLFTTAGIYTVVATNSTTGCVMTMSGSAAISVTAPPTAFTVGGGGSYCSGGTGFAVTLSGSQLGVTYQLFVGSTTVGSPRAGTGALINFGIQTTAGTYTVVGSTSGSCSTNMTGSATITVNPLPNIYTVTGGGAYCSAGSGVLVGLSGSDVGVNYQLYRGTATVGTPVAGTGTTISFGLQAITGTYTVIATNATTACVRNMSGSATVTIASSPAPVSLTGGGGYCSGGPGVLIGLAGSAIGVNYQLYRGTTAVGSPVAGAGTAISFGLQTVAGTYTVVGTFASSACSSNMIGSVTVTVLAVPNTYTVTGGGAYCSGGSGIAVGLSGSDIGVSYKLFRSGTPIISLTGTGSPINFGLMTATGPYTVTATNGAGCSGTMSGSVVVTVNPLPTISGSIYTVMPSASITLTGTPSGGTWSSGNTAVATVGSTGVVSGVSLGTVVITYTLPTGCYDVQIINVTPTGFRGVNSNGTITTVPVTFLEVMPNPNRGIFTVKGSVGEEDTKLQLNVVDMLGRVVYTAAASAPNGSVDRVIELGDVPSGRYLLRVQTPKENLVYQIVVEH
jgi:uncharacterized protein YjdB